MLVLAFDLWAADEPSRVTHRGCCWAGVSFKTTRQMLLFLDASSVSGSDNRVVIWNVGTGEAILEIDFPDIPLSASWSWEGREFVVSCKDRKMRVVDPRSGNILKVSGTFLYWERLFQWFSWLLLFSCGWRVGILLCNWYCVVRPLIFIFWNICIFTFEMFNCSGIEPILLHLQLQLRILWYCCSDKPLCLMPLAVIIGSFNSRRLQTGTSGLSKERKFLHHRIFKDRRATVCTLESGTCDVAFWRSTFQYQMFSIRGTLITGCVVLRSFALAVNSCLSLHCLSFFICDFLGTIIVKWQFYGICVSLWILFSHFTDALPLLYLLAINWICSLNIKLLLTFLCMAESDKYDDAGDWHKQRDNLSILRPRHKHDLPVWQGAT